MSAAPGGGAASAAAAGVGGLFDALPQAAVDIAAHLAQAGLPGHYDELRGAAAPPSGGMPGAMPEHWREFFERLGAAGFEDLNHRLAALQRRIRDNGITYNVHADARGAERPWALDLFPLIVPAADWARIERGVLQRTQLLEAMMRDLYDGQSLLERGLLPPALVHGHPGFLRAMRGVVPPGGGYLHIAAYDLTRDAEGRWLVVGQKLQSPSGLGYLLENRITVSSFFPEAFREMRVQRLAASYRALVDNMMRASGAGSAARVVLLTPGPANETYFEHVYLARYLGLTLVEGQDLVVRDERVYLRTIQGLEPVHAILRRLDDVWLDPLELRADSALGVPGLLQALRAGNVVLANAPGAGFLESPALFGYLDGIARELLGAPLELPSLASRWCAEQGCLDAPDAWAAGVLKATYAVGPQGAPLDRPPVFLDMLDEAARAALLAQVRAAPEDSTLQAMVPLAQTPTWVAAEPGAGNGPGRIEPRQYMLRVFVVGDGAPGRFRVLPGGLVRTAGATQHTVSMQRGGSSADCWVLTEGEVDTTTLLPAQLRPQDLAVRHRPVSSRAGENLFWLGRYTERVENTVRLARITLEFLAGAENPSPVLLHSIHRLCIENGLINPAVPSPAQARRLFERALVAALGDARNATSIAYNLRSVQRAATTVRERLSREHWELMVTACDDFQARLQAVMHGEDYSPGQAQRALEQVAIHIAAITGSQIDRMTRDPGWRLLSVGRQLERLGTLANALHEGFASNMVLEEAGFYFMLGVFDSTITYRAQFQRRIEIAPLLDLLVLDTDNPRALAWVAQKLSSSIDKLPLARADAQGNGPDLTLLVPQPASWPLVQLCERDPQGHYNIAIWQLKTCEELSYRLSDELGQRYFTHVRSPMSVAA